MQAQTFHPMSDPENKKGWKFVDSLSDEFVGSSLDQKKWWDHNPGWIGRPPVHFRPECVQLRDNELVLTAQTAAESQRLATLPEGFTHIAGYVKSKQPLLYGYFEMEAKLMDAALVSGFWFYNSEPHRWTELNLVEIPAGLEGYRSSLITNVHVHHSPDVEEHLDKPVRWECPYDLTKSYHVFGLEWNKESIRWYFDGDCIRQEENQHWHQPLYININNESNDWWKALPDDNHLPASYRVRYVRTWTQT